MGDEDGAAAAAGARKTFWRSASWSSSRSTASTDHPKDCSTDSAMEKNATNGQSRRFPVPLTPRSQNCKARSCLPPLQPLSIARRSLDEWPKAGSDDVGEWPQPPTPSGRADPNKPGQGLKLDLSSLRTQGKKDQIALFDKECSKVAEHIYLGGDVVARNREILRENGITHVLNCVGFVCPEYFKSDLVYKTLWLQDSPTEDITSILYDVFDYFEDVRQQQGRVLVHCCQGVSRSTSLVIAYLMWREGQSFDDAFQFVKAARGIANPNMGFACQLLQCQKRVHAIPLSPNSVLRMYRMAPHSPYDPLHLVPKMLNDPSPSGLDSRGAFILHGLSSIYVWIGKSCDPMMEKDAKAAAFQVVRYERVEGPIVLVEEGEELQDFWEAFSNTPLTSDTAMNVNKENEESTTKIGAGKKKVESYDVDFELFYKAITGGVVPPFSSSVVGQETHLPARESNWSILRRKFISGSMKEWVSASKGALSRVYSNSVMVRGVDTHVNRVQLLTAESSISPPYLSPSSISSDSSSSSKGSMESPSISPSTCSPSLTPSPASSNLSDSMLQSPRPSSCPSSSAEPFKPCSVAVSSPSKGFARSLAERRGSFSPLKLPTLTKNSSLLSARAINSSSTFLESPRDVLERDNGNHTTESDAFDSTHNVGHDSDFKCVGELAVDSSENRLELHKNHVSLDGQLPSTSTGSFDISLESSNTMQPLVYRWPNMEKIAKFGRENLDSKAVFLFLTPHTGIGEGPRRMLYLWIGSCFEQANCLTHLKRGRDVGDLNEIDWNRVGGDFLALMSLPKDIPIKVVKEPESEEIFELLNSS